MDLTGVSMRLKAMTITIAAVGLLAGTAVAQEGTLKKIKDTGTITIGHRESSGSVLLLRRQAAGRRLRHRFLQQDC